MKKSSNKGFSLVELIIVIAIMAILVGVMAPQLIKYIEKSKVAADTQYLDTLHTAFLTAYSDVDVITDSTPVNKTIMGSLFDGSVHAINGYGTCSFTQCVLDIVGEPNVNITLQSYGNNVKKNFKSTGAKTNGYVYVCMDGGTLYMWIDGSDRTAQGGNYSCSSVSNLESSNVIYVR